MDYITIGWVVNTHGLKGELRVKPQTHFIKERFHNGSKVFLEIQGKYQELCVVSVREQKDMLLIVFEGYNDINLVEAWKGLRLVIGEDQLQTLDEDEIYYHDLMGMHVISEEGMLLGDVSEIIETGANVIIRVKGEKEVLIPYVKSFIKEVKMEERTLIVTLWEGLL